MTKHAKILATDEAWDEGALGLEEAHAKKFEGDIEKQIDDTLELQPISIRMQKDLLENLKMIAKVNGIGYQPLMRQVLRRFVDSEIKKILRERAREMDEHKRKLSEEKTATDSQSPNKKAA